MRFVVLALIFASAFGSALLEVQFQEWAQRHGKTYPNVLAAEHALLNFEASIARIAKLNAFSQSRNETNGAVFGLNLFSDLSPAEFRARYLMPKLEVPKPTSVAPAATANLPPRVDWRAKGAVTAVKNQEQCGSCWAFSATEAIESAHILAGKGTNTTTILAPQQIVDCDTGGQDQGCNGGFPVGAYAYIQSAGGQDTEASYPYQGVDGQCEFKSADIGASISGYKPANDGANEEQMVSNMVSWGPLSVCVDASAWQDYTSGTMKWWQCAIIVQLDHCVQLVGYDQTDSSNQYYMVRNSWTTQWGINGYIHLEMGEKTCGIEQIPTWPTAA